MIALVSTLLIAAYILGPDLFARWLLGFVVQRKNIVQTKSEEITRGILWAIVPLTIAWFLRHTGPFAVAPGSRFDAQTFFSGIYSEAYFSVNREQFFAAAGSFLRLNLCILLRLYFVVLAGALFFNWTIQQYGRWRKKLSSHSRFLGLLSKLILPRISEWHVILSPLLLPDKDMTIAVDVMTKSGVLYQGSLADKVIGADGGLQSLTLENPRRFRREQYVEDRKNNPAIDADQYWKTIPGNLFVILGPDIASVNVRHLPSMREFIELDDIADALREVVAKIKRQSRSALVEPGGIEPPTSSLRTRRSPS